MIAQDEYQLTVDQNLTSDAMYQHIEITVDFAGNRDRQAGTRDVVHSNN
jgi:hypothetical protein